MGRSARRLACAVAMAAVLPALVAVVAAPGAQADPQVTIPVSCDRPNTGITAGLFANLNNEIPDPINSDSLMRVVDVERPVPGTPTRVELILPFPDLAGGFPPNDFGVTYGTFYIKSVEITVPIPAGYDLATVTPSESPEKSYVTATRSGSNLVVRVQSPVSGSRIRINTEVASPVAEVETSSGVWTPVVMPTIVINPTVTAAAGSTITWRPPSLSNAVVKWNRDFGIFIGQINWNDVSMPCTPQNPNQVVATTTVGSPSLTVAASADESAVVAGETVHLHVTVTNTGDVPLTGVTVTDANAPGCAGSVGTLAVGASAVRNCTVTTSPADVPTFTNSAGADSNETAPVGSNTVSVTVASPAATGVAGRVRDIVSQGGVPGAWVALLRTSDYSIAGSDVADGSGDYVVNVPPGNYLAYGIDPTGAHQGGFFGAPTPVGIIAGAMTPVDPVLTPTRGSVAGTITAQGSGTAIGGAWALASSGTTFAPEALVEADPEGAFRIDDLAAGAHFLTFLDPSGAHAPEYHADSPGPAGAGAVAVVGGATATADGTPPGMAAAGGGATLEGSVTEAGTNAPLEGVAVVVLRGSDFTFVRGGRTDASGVFSIPVPAGPYRVAFIDPSGHHHMEWHDDLPYNGLAASSTVTAPGVVGAVLSRTRGAVAGTITDDPSGQPLPGAWVVAIGPRGIAGGAVTGSDGSYTIDGLPAGTYRATMVDPVGGRTQEYWNGATSSAGASPITVAGGATTTIDAALRLP